MAFVHLHNHTEYSLLDGHTHIYDMVKRAADLGMPAVAISDHGVMSGVPQLCEMCDKVEEETGKRVKPIYGCEVYFTTDEELRKDTKPKLFHLLLLAKTNEGYHNLVKLVSESHVDNFYYKPRTTFSMLQKYGKGIIGSSACIAGIIPKLLDNRQFDDAVAWANKFASCFEPGDFYIELQNQGIRTDAGFTQTELNHMLTDVARAAGLKTIATNDFHYLTKEDAKAQDYMLCVAQGAAVNDEKRMRFSNDEFYMKSEEEMREALKDFPEACDTTVEVAEKVNVVLERDSILPRFPLPEGETEESYFRRRVQEGLVKHYGSPVPQEAQERADYEMGIIIQQGFPAYFLIVQEYIEWARSQGIGVGPGRGSAAGSMVSYCLRITDIDPMQYSLYFERFLNPERVSMPDIDMDFGDTRRGEVVDYVRRKYGDDHVAQIVTFGTMAARAAIRDVGRVLNMTYAETDTVAKLVPTGPHITLEDALKLSKQLSDLYQGDPRVHKLIDTARALEGMPRHASTHAAGVVITKRPVYEYVPLAKNDDAVVCQYVMTTLEELGLLKMDFLGLRNLTVLDDAVKMVQRDHPDFRLADIPMDDRETFDMLTQGKTGGVFQMESSGMTGVCLGLKPQSIEDITAIIALYRPGPMDSIPRFVACKHDPSLVTYKHPKLEPILSGTYGCIVYQEQVIKIFQELAGYSLGQADMVRRAMSKKKAKDVEREREAFLHGDPSRSIRGCVPSGIPEATAQDIFNEIYDFANYAFNKAHAVSYAVVAYQTAYFKCHFTREYMAALLTSVLDNSDKVAEYIAECKDCGIALLPPDVNRSYDRFTVEEGGIRFGLVAVKNIGRGFIQAVVRQRQQDGPFASFQDFCQRMFDCTDMNKRAVENLIRCGAFDSLGARRSQLVAVYERVLDGIASSRRKNVEGQMDLFGMSTPSGAAVSAVPLPDIPEFTAVERMNMEKDTTGLYLSGHPMEDYRPLAKRAGAVPIHAIMSDFEAEGGPRRFADGQNVTVAGVITASRTRTTKSNTLMAYVTIEDELASMELLCFSRVIDQCGSYMQVNTPVLVKGRLSVRDEKPPQIMCDSLYPLESGLPPAAAQPARRPAQKESTIYLRFPSADSPAFRHIKLVMTMFEGGTPVKIRLADTGKLLGTHCLNHPALLQECQEWLGSENVVVKEK